MPMINRRRFIQLGVGGLAALRLQDQTATAAPLATRADVIVIGAGIAGLQAAGKLKAAGKSVMVLEAQAQTGGRMTTSRSLGNDLPLDLGASWIHGIKGNPITAIADRLKLSRVVTDYDAIQRYDFDGRALTDTESDDVDTLFNSMMKKVGTYQKSAGSTATLESGINKLLPIKDTVLLAVVRCNMP